MLFPLCQHLFQLSLFVLRRKHLFVDQKISPKLEKMMDDNCLESDEATLQTMDVSNEFLPSTSDGSEYLMSTKNKNIRRHIGRRLNRNIDSLSEDEKRKLVQRRERNKQAAAKFREKIKRTIQDLEEEKNEWEKKVSENRARIDKLKAYANQLREICNSHKCVV